MNVVSFRNYCCYFMIYIEWTFFRTSEATINVNSINEVATISKMSTGMIEQVTHRQKELQFYTLQCIDCQTGLICLEDRCQKKLYNIIITNYFQHYDLRVSYINKGFV